LRTAGRRLRRPLYALSSASGWGGYRSADFLRASLTGPLRHSQRMRISLPTVRYQTACSGGRRRHDGGGDDGHPPAGRGSRPAVPRACDAGVVAMRLDAQNVVCDGRGCRELYRLRGVQWADTPKSAEALGPLTADDLPSGWEVHAGAAVYCPRFAEAMRESGRVAQAVALA